MTPIIRKGLLELVFSGSFMKRWNDKLRPIELAEVDKQAHKMILAWLLFALNSREMDLKARLALGEEIVEGGIFEYLYRLVITDIKPPVFYRIKANRADYQKLTEWVLEQLKTRITPLGPEFGTRMRAFLMDPDDMSPARRILLAAHLYASHSEFRLIKTINPPDDELIEIEQSFVDRLGRLTDLVGVAELLDDDSVLGRFASKCGQLRFQKRWSQTPRIPETTVLGHMFIVAAFGWLFSLEVGACRARRQNNFFAGLFHDLPELLTRDIISPVKSSSAEIAGLIREYEHKELERVVLLPLRDNGYPDLAERLVYFLGLSVGSEFSATVREDGRVRKVSSEDIGGPLNLDALDPKDGDLLKICDRLAAFIEASTALRNGIASDQLHQACWRIKQFYQKTPVTAGIHIGSLLADFD
ncbi:MAG: HD domain-containing protein [Desulfovibrionaceae bacterium]|nr:HD domain-containing protein [Desulfovibrionaceae bacterium]